MFLFYNKCISAYLENKKKSTKHILQTVLIRTELRFNPKIYVALATFLISVIRSLDKFQPGICDFVRCSYNIKGVSDRYCTQLYHNFSQSFRLMKRKGILMVLITVLIILLISESMHLVQNLNKYIEKKFCKAGASNLSVSY